MTPPDDIVIAAAKLNAWLNGNPVEHVQGVRLVTPAAFFWDVAFLSFNTHQDVTVRIEHIRATGADDAIRIAKEWFPLYAQFQYEVTAEPHK